MFANFGREAKDKNIAVGFRLWLAAVYSCRAIAELMLDAADQKELTVDREELKAMLITKLPYFNLIERIRIHDFHRFGIIPPNPELVSQMFMGPMKLVVSKGSAAVFMSESGPVKQCTGNSRIVEQRPLFMQDGLFRDEDTGTMVPLPRIIESYILGVNAAVEEFEKLYLNRPPAHQDA